jgi:thymidylate synthase ThyX
MIISAKTIADSIHSGNIRITTMQITLPKVILAEFLTHRVFSRNFSSSRAIPTSRFNALDSFEPVRFLKNQSGMQAMQEEITNPETARAIWRDTIEYCKIAAEKLSALGVHKQWANRVNDWHVMATGIVTSTDWDNWFALRDHPDAQPEIRELAVQMRHALESSTPRVLQPGEWHLPYVTDAEITDPFFEIPANVNMLKKISAARCCRVSYLKHDGTTPNIDDDLALYQRLAGAVPRHYSPLEHIATPDIEYARPELHGNLHGWIQFRRMVERDIVTL